MLELEAVEVFYGKAQALADVTIGLPESGIVGLVGRNGAGKTTILRTLMGLLIPRRGRRLDAGADITRLRPHETSRRGIAFVPEDRQIFPNLTVEENLLIAGIVHRPGYWTLSRVLELFPRLQERMGSKGASLSGGEQQMLSIARAVLTNPRALLLDEPSEGLAPLIVNDVRDAIVEINRQGVAVLLVEQKIAIPVALASHIYVVDHGRIGWSGSTEDFARDRETIDRQLAL